VFCDTADGSLAARSLSDEADDVISVMTSSVSNVRRTSSVFESTAAQQQIHGVHNNPHGVPQLHGVHGVQQLQLEGVPEERGVRRSVKELAACVEMLNRAQTFHSDTITETHQLQQQQQQPGAGQVEQVYSNVLQVDSKVLQVDSKVLHVEQQQLHGLEQAEAGHQAGERFSRKLGNIQRPTTTTETVAATSPATPSSVTQGVTPWNRVPAQPGTALDRAREPAAQVMPGSRVPAEKRVTPPVSRVKPMIRPTIAASTTNQRPDISAHAPPSSPPGKPVKPVPVVASRTHKLSSVADIPAGTETLSVADVAKCVTLLGLSQQKADVMASHGVDGRRLIELSISDMTNEPLRFTPLEASKLARFARGWRPAS